MKLHRGEVWLARPLPLASGRASNLDAVRENVAAGAVLVVSPSDLNDHLHTVIVVPVSRERATTPFRPAFGLAGERAVALVDQVRTIERARLFHRVGMVSAPALERVLSVLRLAFGT
jgi:mRNA interferase MazF